MGLVFEELIRKFAEISNETAGEHFTPREVIRLMVNLIFVEDDDVLSKPSVVRSIYDPTAGTGGMLSIAGEYLHEHNPKAQLTMSGQELNGSRSRSSCRSARHDAGPFIYPDANALAAGGAPDGAPPVLCSPCVFSPSNDEATYVPLSSSGHPVCACHHPHTARTSTAFPDQLACTVHGDPCGRDRGAICAPPRVLRSNPRPSRDNRGAGPATAKEQRPSGLSHSNAGGAVAQSPSRWRLFPERR